MLPEIGQIIGRYRVLDKIGEGGMGVVYRAHDEHLSRDVAIKLLPPGALVDGSARQRFRNEALALAKLNHPNIATLFDFESRDEMDFLVTEYIRGESLDAKIERTPLPEKEVIRLGAQLAAGLVAAHDAGVLHRDLKPGNIRVTPEGLLKILDFGLARLLQSTSTDTTPTQAGTGATADGAATATSFAATVLTTFAGTPPYMSPEQVTGEPLDCRSDIYSAGTVLYEMVSGKRAFPQESTSEVVQAILKVAPASPRSFVDISSGLELVILKALSKQRTARQQNARELFSDLERLGAPSARRRRSRVESIAVLPVVNHTGDTELEYLCEGITEELINEFASLEGLKKVIARNSVYRYRGRHLIPEEIGRELGVRAVLMGRLEHHAESLSLGLELVDAADSGRLWGGQFQPSQGQLSGLMREVAGAVSSKLGLAPKNERTAKRANKASGLAYDLYLKGRYCWNKRPAPGMIAKAVELFEQSSEADPKFALAYAGLADSYNVQGAWEAGTLAPQMAFPAAKKAADRALRLDANLAEAHAARAYAALHFDWDWTVAEKGFQRSLELSPNYVHCRHWRSHLLVVQERFDEALEESKRIIELDPLDLIINVHLAWHYLVTHDFARGLDAAEKSLELEPNFYWGHYFAGNAREQLGELDSAVDALQRARQLSGNATVMRTALAHAWAVAGDHNRAKRELNELVTLSRTQYVSPYELGLIHLAMDEMEEGWRLLRQACHERSGWMPYLKLEPRLLKFRSDPNFKDLLLEVGH